MSSATATSRRSELRVVDLVPLPSGQRLTIEVFGERGDIDLPLVGEFQASNALAALGLAIATGAAPREAVAVLTRLSGVPGRMQFIGKTGGETASGAAVFVDYAHTPDALATVLTALRPHTERRLCVVFGAGGDRDRGKRPLMGSIASDLADLVYVTDDNPRSEDPAEIRRAILGGGARRG